MEQVGGGGGEGGGGGDGQRYIGVWIPPEDQALSNDKSCVLVTVNNTSCSKELAELLKRNARARFLKFTTEAEAWESLEEFNTVMPIPPTTVATMDSPMPDGGGDRIDQVGQGRRRRRLSLPAMNNVAKINIASPKKMVGEERDSRFPTPKIQELTAMAREIISKNNSAVKARVEANPKMLINDCDRPTTVQEGCRYNALHVAAKADNDEIIGYILNKVGSFKFMSMLYNNKSTEAICDLIRYATDLYLNTPDKLSNETPLHFATKFLCVNAVQVLVQHPWCKLDVVNDRKETPLDIIGTRGDFKAIDFHSKKDTVIKCMEAMYIIPVWRDPGGFRMPQFGPVVHIRELGNRLPECLIKSFPDFEISLLGACQEYLTQESKLSDNSSIRVLKECSQWKIQAFAGPTTKDIADELFLLGKLGRFGIQVESPPHVTNGSSSNMLNSPKRGNLSAEDMPSLRTPPWTPRKRLSIGNFCTNSPLLKHNGYVTPPSSPCKSLTSPAIEESNYRRLVDGEKGLERYAMEIVVAHETEWQENWEFLKYFGNILSYQGLSKIESCLNKCDFYEKFSSSCDVSRDRNFKDISLDEISEVRTNNYQQSQPDVSLLVQGMYQSFFSKYLADEESSSTSSGDSSSASSDNSSSTSSDNCLSTSSGDSSSISSDLSFHSAESDADDEFFDLTDKIVFIDGAKPGKHDFQIFAALKAYEDKLSIEQVPLTFQWFNTMKSSGFCGC